MKRKILYAPVCVLILLLASCGNTDEHTKADSNPDLIPFGKVFQIDSGLWFKYELRSGTLPDQKGFELHAFDYHRTYHQLWGTITIRDSMGEDTVNYARSFPQVIAFNLRKVDIQNPHTFDCVGMHEFTHECAPPHARAIDPFPLTSNPEEIVDSVRGLQFCMRNGKRVDVLEEAFAEIAPMPLMEYASKSYEYYRVGHLLAECTNKRWIDFSDCFLALNTSHPEIVISKLTKTPGDKLYPEYTRIVLGIFIRAYNAPGKDDWKKEVEELEYYQKYKRLKTPFK